MLTALHELALTQILRSSDLKLTHTYIGLGKENKNATYEKVRLLVPQIKGCDD